MESDPKYQEESVFHSRTSWVWRSSRRIPSGYGILKRGGISVELSKLSRRCRWRSDDWGDKGGMAQINIPSLKKMMIAVFVAYVYSVNNQKLTSMSWKNKIPQLHDRHLYYRYTLKNMLNNSSCNSQLWKQSYLHRSYDRSECQAKSVLGSSQR